MRSRRAKSSICLFLKLLFLCEDPLYFHIHFRFSLSISKNSLRCWLQLHWRQSISNDTICKEGHLISSFLIFYCSFVFLPTLISPLLSFLSSYYHDLYLHMLLNTSGEMAFLLCSLSQGEQFSLRSGETIIYVVGNRFLYIMLYICLALQFIETVTYFILSVAGLATPRIKVWGFPFNS